jgi:uncharacterized FlaG/YvyC family protein
MTAEQELVAIGRLVVQRQQAERHETVLWDEIDQAANQLEAARKLIKLAIRDTSGEALADPSLDTAIKQIPSADTLKTLLSDFREHREALLDLRTKTAKLGI